MRIPAGDSTPVSDLRRSRSAPMSSPMAKEAASPSFRQGAYVIDRNASAPDSRRITAGSWAEALQQAPAVAGGADAAVVPPAPKTDWAVCLVGHLLRLTNSYLYEEEASSLRNSTGKVTDQGTEGFSDARSTRHKSLPSVSLLNAVFIIIPSSRHFGVVGRHKHIYFAHDLCNRCEQGDYTH